MTERTTFEEFLIRARAAHGIRYDYSKVQYETTEKKVIIICKEHGEFLLRPRAHYADLRGCPKCDDGKKSGFSFHSKWAERTKTLYLLELYNSKEHFIKIGVTEEQDLRMRLIKGQTPYEYKILFEKRTSLASNIEREIKEKFEYQRYHPNVEFRGHMECFGLNSKLDILNFLKKLKIS